jgi:hypothetical protein
VRCSISSPSADRISRVWCFGIGQFAVCSQSVSKEAYDFASLPTPPRHRGVLPLGRYASHRHRFCRGSVDGGWDPCAPINGPLTPPSIRFRSTQLGEP